MSESHSFVLIKNGQVLHKEGDCDTRYAPCSTFKIVLSLAGFEHGILQNAFLPQWDYVAKDEFCLDSWKAPHCPSTWIKNSCVWYSQRLAVEAGRDVLQNAVDGIAYGNRNIGEGKTAGFWLSGSLKISVMEQAVFAGKLSHSSLPFSARAMDQTKSLLCDEEKKERKLFGKTGSGTDHDGFKTGWYVGWFDKDNDVYAFAYLIRHNEVLDHPAGRMARAALIRRLFDNENAEYPAIRRA